MSSSLTSRLKLYKADPGTGEQVDVAKLNQALDKIDAAIGPAVVTSTSRPSIPYPGQLIWETDTKRILYRDNLAGAWVVIYDPTPWIQISAPTITWSNTGTTQPSLGNGALIFRYQEIGRSVNFMLKLFWGSTTTGGDAAGFWSFGGVPSNLNRATADLFFQGGCFDSSGPNLHELNVQVSGSGSTFLNRLYSRNTTGTLQRIGPNSPFVWASADVLQLSGTFEKA